MRLAYPGSREQAVVASDVMPLLLMRLALLLDRLRLYSCDLCSVYTYVGFWPGDLWAST
jgi:hypothetical protein